MSNKIRTTLTLNKDVVIRAKSLDINLSAEAEKGIIDKIRELEFIHIKNKETPSIIESSGPKGIRTPVTGSEGR